MPTRNLDITNFDKRYKEKVIPDLMKTLNQENHYALPKLEKIVLNAGIGSITGGDKKKIESIVNDITLITTQKPVKILSKKAIAGFGIRQGAVVGVKVTMRSGKMKEFFNKLVFMAFPRIRDFQGISSNCFDDKGNFSYGIKEQIIFPEIKPEESLVNFGMQVNFKTTAKDKEEAKVLLQGLGLPIKD